MMEQNYSLIFKGDTSTIFDSKDKYLVIEKVKMQ